MYILYKEDVIIIIVNNYTMLNKFSSESNSHLSQIMLDAVFKWMTTCWHFFFFRMYLF